MANCKISNPDPYAVALPYPFRGVLAGGQSVIVAATSAQVLTALGGTSYRGGLQLADTSDTNTDAFYTGEAAGGSSLKAANVTYSGGTTVQAALDAGMTVKKVSQAMAFGLFSGLAGGVKTYTLNFSSGALPANARIAGYSISAMTGFDDAAHGNYGIELGVAAANDVMASTSVKAGAAAAPKAGTAASLGYFGAPAVGTPSIKMTGSNDLNTATVGTVTVELFYFVLA